MKFLTSDEDLLNGDSEALSHEEIMNLINFVRPKKEDIFYDLGSGFGSIVIEFVKHTRVRTAIGIEDDIKRYLHSIEFTRDELSKHDLTRLELWCADFYHYDFSDATIVYNGIDVVGNKSKSDLDEIELYNTYFKDTEVKIIKRDFPLIGYRPVKSFKNKTNSWFFMMKTPLEKYRLHDYGEWLWYGFANKNKSIDQICNYYAGEYKKREIFLNKNEINEFKRNFKRMVRKQFDAKSHPF